MKNLNYFITKKKIPSNTRLRYLITIPCVNREERNAINVIDKTFEIFDNSGLFNSNIDISILLFESGSNNTNYLKCIDTYKIKYPSTMINIIYSNKSLNGISNTFKMFFYIKKLPLHLFDFIIWMDDDIYVCKNFIKNADAWIKNYANYSLFSSLYVPYNTFLIKDKKDVQMANLPGFYGTCCTIFKPRLANFVIPFWYDSHFEEFNYNPDTRFRDSVRKYFPSVKRICVSFPSLVEHMNIGSAIKEKKDVKIGHKAKFFIGIDNDPKFYNDDNIFGISEQKSNNKLNDESNDKTKDDKTKDKSKDDKTKDDKTKDESKDDKTKENDIKIWTNYMH